MKQAILGLAGIIALAAVAVLGLNLIEWLRPEGHNTALDGQIIIVVTILGGQLIGFIRSAFNAQQLTQINKKADHAEQTAQNAPDLTIQKLISAGLTTSTLAKQP